MTSWMTGTMDELRCKANTVTNRVFGALSGCYLYYCISWHEPIQVEAHTAGIPQY